MSPTHHSSSGGLSYAEQEAIIVLSAAHTALSMYFYGTLCAVIFGIQMG